jgi:hypothetical protein
VWKGGEGRGQRAQDVSVRSSPERSGGSGVYACVGVWVGGCVRALQAAAVKGSAPVLVRTRALPCCMRLRCHVVMPHARERTPWISSFLAE